MTCLKLLFSLLGFSLVKLLPKLDENLNEVRLLNFDLIFLIRSEIPLMYSIVTE